MAFLKAAKSFQHCRPEKARVALPSADGCQHVLVPALEPPCLAGLAMRPKADDVDGCSLGLELSGEEAGLPMVQKVGFDDHKRKRETPSATG